jgi:hypothetical protein
VTPQERARFVNASVPDFADSFCTFCRLRQAGQNFVPEIFPRRRLAAAGRRFNDRSVRRWDTFEQRRGAKTTGGSCPGFFASFSGLLSMPEIITANRAAAQCHPFHTELTSRGTLFGGKLVVIRQSRHMTRSRV